MASSSNWCLGSSWMGNILVYIWVTYCSFNIKMRKQTFKWRSRCSHTFLKTMWRWWCLPTCWLLIRMKSVSIGARQRPRRAVEKMEQPAKCSPSEPNWRASTLPQRWGEFSRLFLAALPHSSDSSVPMGIGIGRRERELRLRPRFTGQPLPQVHMGKHLAALSLFHLSFYLRRRIFHFLFYHLLSPHPRAAVLILHTISCTWLC